jgi:hypothetical protein
MAGHIRQRDHLSPAGIVVDNRRAVPGDPVVAKVLIDLSGQLAAIDQGSSPKPI